MKKDNIFVKKLTKRLKNPNLISISAIYSFFEAKRSPEFYFDGECHSPWEMVYVIDGSAGITADDNIYTLSKGDIIFHKPMEFHKIWSAGGTNPEILILSFDMDGSLAEKLDGVYHISGENKVLMNSLLSELFSKCEESQSWEVNFMKILDKNEYILQTTLNKLELILINLSSLDKSEQKYTHNAKMNLYTRIVEILEDNIYGKITISQISKMCNTSTATIKNCFAEYAGCGVHKYFLNIKIRAAIDMLKNGMNVNEVSDKLQFANPNYFSYVFKRETGMCASEFKKI